VSTFKDLAGALSTYCESYRKEGLPPLALSPLYDLFPAETNQSKNVGSSWPDSWINTDLAGVYAFLDNDLNVLYIGKVSMKSSLGSRLNKYCKYDNDRQCKLVDSWKGNPRYVVTIPVSDNMRFEAPALEEFLISTIQTTDNKAGT